MPEEPEPLLTEEELSQYLRVTVRTIKRWRDRGTGPPVLWAGNRPRYRLDDVDDWLRRRERDI